MAFVTLTFIDNPADGPKGLTVLAESAPQFDIETPHTGDLTFAQAIATGIFHALVDRSVAKRMELPEAAARAAREN